jgi:signal transduction histidine kinase
MLVQHDSAVTVSVDCPENLLVLTDCLRLQQVLRNVGRNYNQFVSCGFVRLRAYVVTMAGSSNSINNGLVELSVEDSGPGIPVDKRDELFQKFQTSLDILNQGTGIGLCLCKNLTLLLKGDICLDEAYHRGIPSSPGARFVIQLNRPPLYPTMDGHVVVDGYGNQVFAS